MIQTNRMKFQPLAASIIGILILTPCGGDDPRNIEWESAAKKAQAEIPQMEAERKKDPSSPKLLGTLGDEYWILGDLIRAEALIEQASKLAPNNPAGDSDLLQILWREGRYAEAIEHAKRFLAFKTSKEEFNQYARGRIEKFEKNSSKVKVQPPSIPSESNEFKNTIGMVFVRVPGGAFEMGSDSWWGDSSPAHRVTLLPYWIGKYEVTVAQYEAFMKDTGFKPELPPRDVRAPSDQHPATGLEWYDAEAFSIWLSTRESMVYRLPTEAEWEFAARGTDGRLHPWGSESPDTKIHGNWDRFGFIAHGGAGALEPVGSYPRGASPFGVLDMSGNAAEWCNDDYVPNYYRFSPAQNPYGPLVLKGLLKVQRGSSWRDGYDMKTTDRQGVYADLPYDHHGFRLVMVPH